jgi:hypothetical protein
MALFLVSLLKFFLKGALVVPLLTCIADYAFAGLGLATPYAEPRMYEPIISFFHVCSVVFSVVCIDMLPAGAAATADFCRA